MVEEKTEEMSQLENIDTAEMGKETDYVKSLDVEQQDEVFNKSEEKLEPSDVGKSIENAEDSQTFEIKDNISFNLVLFQP